MKIKIKSFEDYCVIVLEGNLDLNNAARLHEWVRRLVLDDAPAVVVDASKVAFIDSSSLDCLSRAFATARRRHVPFHFACVPEDVRRIREFNLLKKSVPLAVTIEAALKTQEGQYRFGRRESNGKLTNG